MPSRVLIVGQCSFDYHSIRSLLSRCFSAEAVSAHDADEAVRHLERTDFDLVLVNRQLAADGSEGLDLIKRLKAAPQTQAVPVMMVSNFPDQQELAIAAGAVPGFGKAALSRPETIGRLTKYLATGEAG